MEYSVYYNRIKELEKLMDDSFDYEKIEAEIDELHCYKPVSMRLLATKCKMLNRNNNFFDVIRDYGDLFCAESVEEDNIALWEQVIYAYNNAGMKEKAVRQTYMKNKLLEPNRINDLDASLDNVRDKFIKGDESLAVLNELEELYFYTFNTLMAYCVSMYKAKVYGNDVQNIDRYNEYGNRGYLKERIEKGCTITIISSEDDRTDYDILAYILHELNVTVYMITDIVSLNEEFDLKSSVVVSMDNIQKFEDCVNIPSIERIDN